MRELYVRSGQGFLLVFSITSASSLRELEELREDIIRIKDDPYVPIILVGNKADLEDDRAVSRSRAFQLSQSWGNAPYYESSARNRSNVDQVFKNLCKQIIMKENEFARTREPDPPRRRRRPRHSRRDNRRTRRREPGICTIL